MVDGSETLALDSPGLDRADDGMTVSTGLQNPSLSLQPEPDAEFYMTNVVFQLSMPPPPFFFVVSELTIQLHFVTIQVGGTIFRVPRTKFEVSHFPYYRDNSDGSMLLAPSNGEGHLVLDIDEGCFRGFLRELYPFK
jgi:hypothetical protein